MTFPHVHEDGTFTISREFTFNRPLDRATVDEWLASWVQANDPWERNWCGAGGGIESFRLSFCISGCFPQTTEVRRGHCSSVAREFPGRAARAYYWIDWMV